MSKKANENLVRVSINLPVQLIERVQKYADYLGVNLTTAYIILLNNALDYVNI